MTFPSHKTIVGALWCDCERSTTVLEHLFSTHILQFALPEYVRGADVTPLIVRVPEAVQPARRHLPDVTAHGHGIRAYPPHALLRAVVIASGVPEAPRRAGDHLPVLHLDELKVRHGSPSCEAIVLRMFLPCSKFLLKLWLTNHKMVCLPNWELLVSRYIAPLHGIN